MCEMDEQKALDERIRVETTLVDVMIDCGWEPEELVDLMKAAAGSQVFDADMTLANEEGEYDEEDLKCAKAQQEKWSALVSQLEGLKIKS
jgi:hypothetical protein